MKRVLFACIVLSAAGCVDVTYKPAKDIRYEPTQQVDVLYDAPARPFEVTGRLEWNGTADKVADVLVILIESAKNAGADAIIIRETTWKDTSQVTAVVGQTIKYTVAAPAPKAEEPVKEQPAPQAEVPQPVPGEAQPAPQQELQAPAQAEPQPSGQVEMQQPAPTEVQPEMQPAQPEVQMEQAPQQQVQPGTVELQQENAPSGK